MVHSEMGFQLTGVTQGMHGAGLQNCRHLSKKSQHGCVRWALREHLTPPCSDLACGGLEDRL